MTKKTDQIAELLERGVSEVIVKRDFEKLLRSGKKITLYLGIDPTGSRLHLGHAIALRKLREFQKLGHRVIFLVGSFTALIGDTSDKEAARQPMTTAQIEENFRTYKAQAGKILDFSKVELKYNHEWLGKIDLKKLIELASKFTVQQMIQREMYKKRIREDKPIGLHEFLYPLMQGYDSVAMDVDLEVGGNDQLFNMLAGRVLQKIINNKEKHVITVQLLEGTDGRKMAKTYDNVINITDPADEQYIKIMKVNDNLIIKYFTLCTDLGVPEIEKIAGELAAGTNPRDIKMRLAREIVTMYHSKDLARQAEKKFIAVFQKNELPTDVSTLKIKAGIYGICDLLVRTKLTSSKSEARRLVEQGGVKINEKPFTDPFGKISIGKKESVVQVGKRRFVKIMG